MLEHIVRLVVGILVVGSATAALLGFIFLMIRFQTFGMIVWILIILALCYIGGEVLLSP